MNEKEIKENAYVLKVRAQREVVEKQAKEYDQFANEVLARKAGGMIMEWICPLRSRQHVLEKCRHDCMLFCLDSDAEGGWGYCGLLPADKAYRKQYLAAPTSKPFLQEVSEFLGADERNINTTENENGDEQ